MITFLQINLAVLITYAFYRLALGKIPATAKFRLVLAKTFLVCSLILPVLMKEIPFAVTPDNFPQFEFSEISKNKYDFKKNLTKAYTKTINKNRTSKITMPNEEHLQLFGQQLWWIVLLLALANVAVNFYRIHLALKKSQILRRQGRVTVAISEETSVPFSVWMLGRSWVVIPSYLLLSQKDFSLALAHELQHHRQRDTIWAVFMEIFLCPFFLNPAAHWWKRIIVEEQELACDEALTRDKRVSAEDYASCLVRVAEIALKNRQMHAGTTCMAAVLRHPKYFKTFLLRRIEMIAQKRPTLSKKVAAGTMMLGIFSTMALAFGMEKVARAQAHAVNGGTATLNPEIQKIAEKALKQALNDSRFSSGFVIVSEPDSGKVLAVANHDRNQEKSGHWALAQLIDPASLYKTFIIAQALEENITTPEEMHPCGGAKYVYKGKTYRDWKETGWDSLSTTRTLAISSNLCTMKIAEKIGAESLRKMFKKWGFAEDGSVKDFPEARIGDELVINDQLIPRLSMGYASRVSPLEVVQALGALANGGNLMKPIAAEGESSEVIRRVVSQETASKMRVMLQAVVNEGTARDNGDSAFYSTAGKTASARLNDSLKKNVQGDERPNTAQFVGMAPVNHPRVVVYVTVTDPEADRRSEGAHGGAHAAPLFKEVTEKVLAYLKVAPDKF